MSASSMSRVENHYSSAGIRINTFFWGGWDGGVLLGCANPGRCAYIYIPTSTT